MPCCLCIPIVCSQDRDVSESIQLLHLESLMIANKDSSTPSNRTVERISIKLIRMDGGTQPRARLDDETVDTYVQNLREGAIYPPVTLFYDGTEYWLADGFHRVVSNQKIGNASIDAEIISGTRRDAVLFSVGANATHGLRRSNADKRRAVETLLMDEEWQGWSDRVISSRCSVSHTFVSQVRQDLFPNQTAGAESKPKERIAQRGGTTYVVKTQNIGQGKKNVSKGSKRQRKKEDPKPLPVGSIVIPQAVKQGEVWQLGDRHLIFCGQESSLKFQDLLPEEITLLLNFPTTPESWLPTIPRQVKSALSFYTPYGEDLHLETIRGLVSTSISGTTDADDAIVITGLPDPSLFLLIEDMECHCYCAEPSQQLCSDALTAWAITRTPSKRMN